MRIAGRWYKCEDGVSRPVVLVRVRPLHGSSADDLCLIDIGADRTVFGAALLNRLRVPSTPAPCDVSLTGVGGKQPFVEIEGALDLTRDDGGAVTMRGAFAAFMDPTATDLSVLGRDVLNHFLSRRRNEIALLAGHHRYEIHSS